MGPWQPDPLASLAFVDVGLAWDPTNRRHVSTLSRDRTVILVTLSLAPCREVPAKPCDIGRHQAAHATPETRPEQVRQHCAPPRNTPGKRLLIRRFWVRIPGGAPQSASSEVAERLDARELGQTTIQQSSNIRPRSAVRSCCEAATCANAPPASGSSSSASAAIRSPASGSDGAGRSEAPSAMPSARSPTSSTTSRAGPSHRLTSPWLSRSTAGSSSSATTCPRRRCASYRRLLDRRIRPALGRPLAVEADHGTAGRVLSALSRQADCHRRASGRSTRSCDEGCDRPSAGSGSQRIPPSTPRCRDAGRTRSNRRHLQ